MASGILIVLLVETQKRRQPMERPAMFQVPRQLHHLKLLQFLHRHPFHHRPKLMEPSSMFRTMGKMFEVLKPQNIKHLQEFLRHQPFHHRPQQTRRLHWTLIRRQLTKPRRLNQRASRDLCLRTRPEMEQPMFKKPGKMLKVLCKPQNLRLLQEFLHHRLMEPSPMLKKPGQMLIVPCKPQNPKLLQQ